MLGATTCIIGIIALVFFGLDIRIENKVTQYCWIISGIAFVVMAVLTFIFESSLCY